MMARVASDNRALRRGLVIVPGNRMGKGHRQEEEKQACGKSQRHEALMGVRL